MKYSHLITAVVAGGIGIAVGAGWNHSPDAAYNAKPAFVDQQDIPHTGDGIVPREQSDRDEHVKQPKATIMSAGRGEASEDPGVVTVQYNQALATIDDLRALVADDTVSEAKDRKVQAMLQGLLTKASNDSMALSGLIEQFRADPTSRLGQQLATLLAEIKDPEVEQMAQDLALSRDSGEVMTGLDLLGDLKIANKQTFDITSQLLAQSTADPDVLMRAINAMPVMTVSEQETTQTLQQLSQLAAQHPSDGVRSNSLFKISEWAKDAQDLAPVISALEKSRPTDDRISAAMAIAQSKVVDDALRVELLSRMADKDELWEVRRYAAESLERFKLSGRDVEQFQAFKREQVDLQTQG